MSSIDKRPSVEEASSGNSTKKSKIFGNFKTIGSLSPGDSQFEHVKTLAGEKTILQFPAQDELVELMEIEKELKAVLKKLSISISEEEINDLGPEAAALEQKRQWLTNKHVEHLTEIKKIEYSLSKANQAVTYWMRKRDYNQVARWRVIVVQAESILVHVPTPEYTSVNEESSQTNTDIDTTTASDNTDTDTDTEASSNFFSISYRTQTCSREQNENQEAR